MPKKKEIVVVPEIIKIHDYNFSYICNVNKNCSIFTSFGNRSLTIYIENFKSKSYEGDIYFDKGCIDEMVSKKIGEKFISPHIIKANGTKFYMYSVSDLFAMISRIGYCDTKKALSLLRMCYEIIKIDRKFDTYLWLYDAVSYQVLHLMSLKYKDRETEVMQPEFVKLLSRFIPGAKIVDDYRFDRKHIPDLMIDVDGKIRPVEIKKKKATGQAIKQIARYIDFYKADKGYLVAPELSIKPPDNVIYVPFVSSEHIKEIAA